MFVILPWVLLAYTERQINSKDAEGHFTHVKRQKTIFYDEETCVADLVMKIEEWGNYITLFNDNVDSEVSAAVLEALSGKPRNKKGVRYDHVDLLGKDTLNKVVDYYLEDFETFDYDVSYY